MSELIQQIEDLSTQQCDPLLVILPGRKKEGEARTTIAISTWRVRFFSQRKEANSN